ncbi:LysR family transcriptional regulator [Bordetella genomosp. 7]|uniref:LysR family transcriptional regulator n=1 Tax=Bordetella genomosp. 7 TaxID=1416805 RepID=A0A261RQF1_9BORD|nr:LysR family transcriptional regulator [Bordetella genomosp. 7]OZI27195.1 LysR family transcriptional regulator [Bordetella genomosp. 7]
MDIRYLNHFLKVVQLGSMSEAARQLGLSPAAIAQQMRALEKELGMSLLVRQGRSVRPTAAGQRLAERGPALVQDADALRDWVATDEDAGELRLGTVNTALHGFLPDILQAFSDQYPNVRISLRIGITPALYSALVQSELDAALCLKLSFDLPKTVCWTPLRQEPLVVLAPARDAARDPLELLRSAPLLRYDRQLAGGQLAQRYLQAQGIRPRERLELNSIMALALLVERGLGVSLVPDIGQGLAGPGLCKLAVPALAGESGGQAPPPRELGLLWRNPSQRGRWLNTLLQCAQQVVRAA